MFFDFSSGEFLLTAVVAVVVIGPKDLPRAMRALGKWMGTVRRVSGHFRSGIETMIREAEMEEMEKKWREQNEAIMQAHPPGKIEEIIASGEFGQPPVAPEVLEHAPTEPLRAHEIPVDPHSASAKAAQEHGSAPTPAQGA